MGIVFRFLLFLGLIVCSFPFSGLSQNTFKSEDDLKKQAEKLFEEGKYEEALPLFSQLLSLYQKDPNYNFKYGTCLLYATEDKEKPLMYLSFAASKPNVDNDVFFHFGRALQLNYRFEDAIKQYENFKKNASAKSITSSQVDLFIENCNHGKELLSHITKLQVLEKKDLKSSDFFMSYDLSDLGGKLVVKPEDFLTPIDIKKKDQSLMHIVPGANEYYFSSYGESDKNSRDIYKVVKLPSGEFSKPINLGPVINTNKDEDYPFMHPNGRTLYFCSKGHNSMGGYDIFKSEWNPGSSTWSKPINLDFAINSPDDDIMFITNKDNTLAYFASTRSSVIGRTHIYKIKLDEQKEEILLVSGKLNLPPGKELAANIQVRDLNAKRKIIGVYQTNKQTGQYVLSVPNGGNVEITVEVPKYATLTRSFEVPKLSDFTRTLKQEITENPNDENSLVLNNKFDEPTTEEDRNFALAFIKQSANLDVNYDASLEELNKEIEKKEESDITAAKSNRIEDNKASEVASINEEIKVEETNTLPENPAPNQSSKVNQEQSNLPSNTAEKDLSESALVNMAYEDAKETQQEANELKNEAITARQVANKKKQTVEETKQLLTLTKTKTENLEPGADKEKGIMLIKELEQKITSLEKQAEIADAIAFKLEESARKKQTEADADLKYANDLETAVKSKSDKTAIARLTEQRRQIEENQSNYSADTEYEEAKDALNAKQLEIEKNNTRIAELNKEIQDLENEKNTLIKEQGKTKDKNFKQTLTAQISEIEADQQSKRNQVISAENKNKLLKIQLDSLSKQIELVNDVVAEIKNITPETNALAARPQSGNPNSTPTNVIDFTELSISPDLPPETKIILSEKSYLKEAEKELKAAKAIANQNNQDASRLKTYKDLNLAIDTDLKLLSESGNNANSKTDKNNLSLLISELMKIKQSTENEIIRLEKNLASANVTLVDENPVAANTTSTQRTTDPETYKQQINQANSITNPQEKEETLIQLNKEWLSALMKENEEARKHLQEAKEEDKPIIQEKLKEIALEINERKAAIKQSEERLTELNNSNQMLAANSANATNTSESSIQKNNNNETNNNENNNLSGNNSSPAENLRNSNNTNSSNNQNQTSDISFAQNPIFNPADNTNRNLVPKGSAFTEINYTSSEATEILKKFTPEQRSEYESMSAVMDSLRMSISKAQTTEEKEKIKQEIAAKSDERRELNIKLSNIIGEANEAQYKAQANELARIKNQTPPTDKTVMAGLLVEESEYFFNEAKTIREQIKSLDDSKNKESFITKAYDLEKRAIEKQIKAYKLYTAPEKVLAAENNTPTPNNNETHIALNSNSRVGNVEENSALQNQSSTATSISETNKAAEIDNNLKENSSETSATQKTNEFNYAGSFSNLSPKQKQTIIDSVKQTASFKEIESINYEIVKQNEKTEVIKSDYNSSINKYNEQLKKLYKLNEELENADESKKAELTNILAIEQQKADSLKQIMQQRRETYDNQKALAIREEEKLTSELNKYDETQKSHIWLALNENEIMIDNSLTARVDSRNTNAETTPSKPSEKTPDVQNIGPAATSNLNIVSSPNPEISVAPKAETIQPLAKTETPIKTTVVSKTVSAPTRVQIQNNKIVLPKTFEEVDAFFEKTEVAANSNENPIPIDVDLPGGLIFKVQVGAFKNPIPQDLFKNFNPVTGERTSSGIIRYTAGFFKKFSIADQAKNEIQALGYRDAFVVAFYNGKRISINEALAMSNEGIVAQNINTNTNTNTNTNQGSINNPNVSNSKIESNESSARINPETNLVVNTIDDNNIKINTQTGVKDLNTATGLIYTVQIGVYRNPVTPAQLYNVFPIYSEILPNGLIRYTSGLYKNEEEATVSKNKIVTKGISDAFVIAFNNGKRISLAQARTISGNSPLPSNNFANISPTQTEERTSPLTASTINSNAQPQNVVVIPTPPIPNQKITANTANETNALNNIEEIPDTGVVYKVQIGAFRNEVPNDIAILFLKVSSKGVAHYLDQDGLTHYTLGKVRTYKEADDLKQYAIQEGIEKPFIVAYKDGNKIDIETAKSITHE